MNQELQKALKEMRDRQCGIEQQLGPPQDLAPYKAPQQSDEHQKAALSELEMMKQQLQVYLLRPQEDISILELARIVSLALPQVVVNPAGQTLESRLGTAARHFVLKG